MKAEQRLIRAEKALSTLCELSSIRNPTSIERDAAIQRFKYTFEAIWKAAREVLKAHEGLDARSPKAVVRSCFQAGIFNDEQAETALALVDDRNLTVHTYNEDLAENIFSRLSMYSRFLEGWLVKLRGLGTQ